MERTGLHFWRHGTTPGHGYNLKPKRTLLFPVGILALLITVGCTPSPSGPAFSQMANTGKTVFSVNCAKCHGDKGQGVSAPAIMGPDSGLQKFGTAQGVFNFISLAMPMDAPASLPRQQYREVLAYLLVENKLVPPDTTFDENALSRLPLK